MKRLLDVALALTISLITFPFVVVGALAVIAEDGWPPFYVAPRIGLAGRGFRMYKLRSMVRHADRTGVDSTAADDPRLLRVGRWLRRLKLDEFPQFWNVLLGDMSLVGPRPNVEREVRLYTTEERGLLSVRPGVTDLASIVFADYEQILRGRADPDLSYNQLIRPWKSRLGLLYARAPWSLFRDLRLIWMTLLTVVDRPRALSDASTMVRGMGGDHALTEMAGRRRVLQPVPPPGIDRIVTDRTAALSQAVTT